MDVFLFFVVAGLAYMVFFLCMEYQKIIPPQRISAPTPFDKEYSRCKASAIAELTEIEKSILGDLYYDLYNIPKPTPMPQKRLTSGGIFAAGGGGGSGGYTSLTSYRNQQPCDYCGQKGHSYSAHLSNFNEKKYTMSSGPK